MLSCILSGTCWERLCKVLYLANKKGKEKTEGLNIAASFSIPVGCDRKFDGIIKIVRKFTSIYERKDLFDVIIILKKTSILLSWIDNEYHERV